MTNRDLTRVAALLVVVSAALYGLHFLLFRDAHHIFLYLVGDIAFLPLDVLIVTLVIDRLLSTRERAERARKLNMVIGAFFSSVGYDLLRELAGSAAEQGAISHRLGLDMKWTPAQMQEAIAWCQEQTFTMQAEGERLARLRELLVSQRAFLLSLLENPMLLEHEVFTDCLWAVSHLTEELAARHDLARLPQTDLKHLEGDLERAYTRLLVQWLQYMIHLKADYPYLYSFAARTNPLREGAQAEIAE